MNQSFTGKSVYETDIEEAGETLGVAMTCRVGDEAATRRVLLDTACPWCILPPAIALELGYELEGVETIRLHSRFGLLAGEMIRLPITFVAEEGEPLQVEATWFLSSDWSGPMVIGWKGCLERMRFAFDPAEEMFYFSAP